MPILKGKDEGKRLVGVHLPTSLYNQLALYSVAKSIPKSTLFRGFIDKWLEEEQLSEEELLGEIAERVQRTWRREKKKHPRAEFSEFLTELKKELFAKGLTKNQVRQVLSNFEG